MEPRPANCVRETQEHTLIHTLLLAPLKLFGGRPFCFRLSAELFSTNPALPLSACGGWGSGAAARRVRRVCDMAFGGRLETDVVATPAHLHGEVQGKELELPLTRSLLRAGFFR